jgi:hypothetical protein
MSIKDIFKTNGEEVWIRTSGNYWYNSWDKKPYNSTEIKQIFVDPFYKDFFILLINSSLFYFWFRIYGDGRHMNLDILSEMSIPEQNLAKYQILLRKARQRFMWRTK